MNFVLFYHSFASCWNHGNAHFLRGVARELLTRGHRVTVFEPADGWSRFNAVADDGADALAEAECLTPGVRLRLYDPQTIDLSAATSDAHVVMAHEWNDPALVAGLGKLRMAGESWTLLFHDTHHRAATAPSEIGRFDLTGYDAVLVFGAVLQKIYNRNGWHERVFTWHEAADTALFNPDHDRQPERDLVWIGNWGDGERDTELRNYLIEPISTLALRARIHGVRYPDAVKADLQARGIDYAGWLPNHRVPAAFAEARLTVHVPRRPYAAALPGIPTIRVFEALACGIPLISALWEDVENLFPAGSYLSVRNEAEMRSSLRTVLNEPALAKSLIEKGLGAIRSRHTCAHRVDELFDVLFELGAWRPRPNVHDILPALAS